MVTKKDKVKDIAQLAMKGGNNKDLLLLERVHKAEDYIDESIAELKKLIPKENIDYPLIYREVLRRIPVPKDGVSPEIDYKKIVKDLLYNLPKPKDGKDAEVDYAFLVNEVIKRIPQPKDGAPGLNGSPDSAEDVRNKLELLEGDERLALSAIKDLEKALTSIERRVAGSQLPASIRIRALINGVLQNSPLESINFGSGLVVTSRGYDYTVSSTGGSGSGITSINGNTNAAQTIQSGGNGIIVSSSGGVTSIINTLPGANFMDNEIVSGSGTTFTIAQATIRLGSEHLYANGQRQITGVDYTISVQVITFLTGSYTAGTVVADYRY